MLVARCTFHRISITLPIIKARMKAADAYDIRDSFEVLDRNQEGSISLDDFWMLYLGLGFQPERISLEELSQKVSALAGGEKGNSSSNSNRVTLDAAMKILSKASTHA